MVIYITVHVTSLCLEWFDNNNNNKNETLPFIVVRVECECIPRKVFFLYFIPNEQEPKGFKPKREKKQMSAANLQLLPSTSFEYDRELIFEFFCILLSSMRHYLNLFRSLHHFLSFWDRVYGGCNSYAHTIWITTGKRVRKKWRRMWQIYRFGSAHLQLLSAFAICLMETKTHLFCRSLSQLHELSNFSLSHNNLMVADVELIRN